MSSLALGGFQVTLVRGGIYYWDGGAIFGVVPKTLWSKKLPADELNRVPLGLNCYIIQTGEHTILLDTGGGDKMDVRARERMKLPPVSKPLVDQISAEGIDPESIDIVINTHLHWDHCGGNTTLAGARPTPSFPRAVYYAPRGEWEHAHQRHVRDRVSYLDENYDVLVESGQMRLIAEDMEIAPGIRVHAAPGHTRDLMIVTAASEGQTFCFLTDLAPTAAHLAPTWVAAFDLYPLQCIESKQRWLARAARDQWICGFGHDIAVDYARITPRDGKFELREQLQTVA